eukprot:scaffold154722_cov36-Cyclotella_meneghiniana.AAC.4
MASLVMYHNKILEAEDLGPTNAISTKVREAAISNNILGSARSDQVDETRFTGRCLAQHYGKNSQNFVAVSIWTCRYENEA